MRASSRRVNWIDEPPCECGKDLGYGGYDVAPASSIRFVEGSGRLLRPTGLIGIAVVAPATRFVWCTDEAGRVVSRVRITEGDLHVMYSPIGGSQQFCLSADLLDSSPSGETGAFGRADYMGVLEIDPRVALLRQFWAQPKYPQTFDVEPFAVRRIGSVRVLGQFAMVSIGTRWFDADGTVHGDLGATTIVPQGAQTRFLKPYELAREFFV